MISPIMVFIPNALTPPTAEDIAAMALGDALTEDMRWLPAFVSPINYQPGIVGCYGSVTNAPDLLSSDLAWFPGQGHYLVCDRRSIFGGHLIDRLKSMGINPCGAGV